MQDYFRTQCEAPATEPEVKKAEPNWVKRGGTPFREAQDFRENDLTSPPMTDGQICMVNKTLDSIRGRYTKTAHNVMVENSGGFTAEGHALKMTVTTTEVLQQLGCIAPNDNQFDFQYKSNMHNIYHYGEPRTDRTGISTVSQFGDISHKIDLRLGFPATTLKGFAFETMKGETIDWMLKGKSDLKTLKDLGIRIWDQNVKSGTEIYKAVNLDLFQRLCLLTYNQRLTMNEYLLDLKIPFTENKEGGKDFDLSARNEEQSLAIEFKLNNWGIPDTKRVLVDGYLGPLYGKQWRNWEDVRVISIEDWRAGGRDKYTKLGFRVLHSVTDDLKDILTHIIIGRYIDQVADLEKAMASRSDSRRIILTGWNVAQLDEMQLPPCHTLAQWYVSQREDEDGKQFLDCKLYQRSADFLLGVPFNIAQYALITEMLAHVHGLRARFLYHTIGDAHIYQNHIDQGFVQEILDRPVLHKSAKLVIKGDHKSILDIQNADVTLEGYGGHEAQKNVPIAK